MIGSKKIDTIRIHQQSVGNLFEIRERMMQEIAIHPFDYQNEYRKNFINAIDSELYYRENKKWA